MVFTIIQWIQYGQPDESYNNRHINLFCELHQVDFLNEGETDNYWCPTAANAIRPLYQLIALSNMRPDGVWSEES